MRFISRIFLWVMLVSLFHTGLAVANHNPGISDANKIYLNPADILVMEDGFQVVINDSYVVVYQLLADENGIFVVTSPATTQQQWPCRRCHEWNVGYACWNCDWPNEDKRTKK